jgi:hypothetical protein
VGITVALRLHIMPARWVPAVRADDPPQRPNAYTRLLRMTDDTRSNSAMGEVLVVEGTWYSGIPLSGIR